LRTKQRPDTTSRWTPRGGSVDRRWVVASHPDSTFGSSQSSQRLFISAPRRSIAASALSPATHYDATWRLENDQDAVAAIRALVRDGEWPPLVPSVVLAESVTGRHRVDAAVNRLLKTCDVREDLPTALARRAGELRHLARRGSAVDAIVVASAEPGGVVLSGDIEDLGALASHANAVRIERI